MKKAPKLTNAERSEIQILLHKQYSIRAIAKALGRSPNTISYEIKNNSNKDGVYLASIAKHKAYLKRKYAKYQGRKIEQNDKLRQFIITQLQAHHSPDEIAGYLKNNPNLGLYVSKNSIYRWLYSEWGQLYCELLYSKRYRPKKNSKPKVKPELIPNRLSIDQRPLRVENRLELGHYEFDSIVSSKKVNNNYSLAVVIERSTRLIKAAIVSSLKPANYAKTISNLVNDVYVQTLTTDNGIENRHHHLITNSTLAQVYFTNTYSSWQKGTVENANKMLRRYFPKGTDFAKITLDELNKAVDIINNKPRKILGYKSALQVAKEKGLFKASVLIEG